MIDSSGQVTQQEFGDLIGISQPAVSDLLSRGVIAEGEPLGVWIKRYCGQLREMAAGRAAAGGLDLATERAALARAQREKIEMQNAVTRGELTPTAVLEQVLAKTASGIDGIFSAIPMMVRRRLPDLPSMAIEIIAAEVIRGRSAVAEMSITDLLESPEQDSGTEEAVGDEGN